jgi:hypothetical protein
MHYLTQDEKYWIALMMIGSFTHFKLLLKKFLKTTELNEVAIIRTKKR